jgi:hypothetical protein
MTASKALADLVRLQSLRVERERQRAIEAQRHAQAARRQADQAAALHANRLTAWQRRFAAEAARPDELLNARAAIAVARVDHVQAQQQQAHSAQNWMRARQRHAAADAAAQALGRMHRDAVMTLHKRAEEHALAEAEDAQTAKVTR